jgi:hypothetical protein
MRGSHRLVADSPAVRRDALAGHCARCAQSTSRDNRNLLLLSEKQGRSLMPVLHCQFAAAFLKHTSRGYNKTKQGQPEVYDSLVVFFKMTLAFRVEPRPTAATGHVMPVKSLKSFFLYSGVSRQDSDLLQKRDVRKSEATRNCVGIKSKEVSTYCPMNTKSRAASTYSRFLQ